MLTLLPDDKVFDRLLDHHDKNEVLMDMYNKQRDLGASTKLSSLFMSRIEALIEEFQSSNASKHSIITKFRSMESDFGDIGYFDNSLKTIKRGLESKLKRPYC